MPKKIIIAVCLVIAIIFLKQSFCFAVSASRSIKQGNRLYREGKFDDALKYYNEAEVDAPDSDVVNFDRGTAFYQKGDYEKAIEAFNKALLSDNPDIEEKAAYNIGNSKYRSGRLKENTDLSAAVNLYRQALDYYKRAIELNQKDTNAKYNHEFVEKELKVLLDKLKQQQKQSQQNSQQKQKQKKQLKAKGQRPKAKEKEDKEKQAESAQGQEKEGGQKKQAQVQTKGYESGQEAHENMSKEEARMILDRYSQQGQSVGNMNRAARGGHYPPVLKDW